MAEPVYDPDRLVSVEMNRLRGRLAGLIESWGLDDRRERAMIQTLKSLTYDSERVLKELVDRQQHDNAIDLIKRLKQWDHLPTVGDGPYWLREINKVLDKG